MFCSHGRLFKRALNQDRAVKRVNTVVKILEMGEEKQRKNLANDKSLKDVVTYIHKKTASLAFIVTLHVAWPKRVGIYSKLIKQDNKENIHHRI